MKKLMVILVVLFSTFLSACAHDNDLDLTVYTSETYYMDTVIDMQVYAANESEAKAACKAAEQEYARIEQISDRFDKKSELYQVNQAQGEAVQVSDDLWQMVTQALEMGKKSGGSFSIAIGAVMDLWDFNGKKHLPSEAELQKILPSINDKNIIIDENNRTITVKNDTVIDLGAVAKGYATDCAVAALKEAGIKHAVINAGGNVYALGSMPDGKPWRIGIRNPRPEDGRELVGIIEVINKSVVTSGDDQRFFEVDGKRYHHILNPQTGMPADESVFATVICENSAMADMLSTAVFVLGPNDYKKILTQGEEAWTVIMDEDGKMTASPGMNEYLIIVD
ncbi:MAG: FAD:protein FMN transferase [Bacillota bacterium]|jgi:thiamine biosynthesis lipoprotein